MINIFKSIEYFGYKIKLRKIYFSFFSYAVDTENISIAEANRLENIMRNVPFGPEFSSKNEVLAALAELRFPGYESFYANQMHGDSRQNLEFMTITIPRVNKYRYFVIQNTDGDNYSVISDFIAPSLPIVQVALNGENLEFLSRTGETIFVKEKINFEKFFAFSFGVLSFCRV